MVGLEAPSLRDPMDRTARTQFLLPEELILDSTSRSSGRAHFVRAIPIAVALAAAIGLVLYLTRADSALPTQGDDSGVVGAASASESPRGV